MNYTPKPFGILSRLPLWKQVNWRNTNPAIASFMGVHKETVRHHRKVHHIARFCGPGMRRYHNRPYRPLTEGQLRRRGLL